MDGILLVDKPSGYTSHDIVAMVKRAYRLKKVGHTGTLDPLATGILPLCINRATPLASQLIAADKVYTATIRWGSETDTDDADGAVVGTAPVPPDIRARLKVVLPEFTGAIQQIPPPYSAVKHCGKPLYWWARKGQPQAAVPREVKIHEIRVLDSTLDAVMLEVHCSKGTYIRSLARDLGRHLGCLGHLAALRRLRTGNFDVKDAICLEDIQKAAPDGAALERWLIPLEKIIRLGPAQ